MISLSSLGSFVKKGKDFLAWVFRPERLEEAPLSAPPGQSMLKKAFSWILRPDPIERLAEGRNKARRQLIRGGNFLRWLVLPERLEQELPSGHLSPRYDKKGFLGWLVSAEPLEMVGLPQGNGRRKGFLKWILSAESLEEVNTRPPPIAGRSRKPLLSWILEPERLGHPAGETEIKKTKGLLSVVFMPETLETEPVRKKPKAPGVLSFLFKPEKIDHP